MEKNLDRLKYMVVDVDGTMTDAGIYYDENGNEIKKFCTKDAAGFFAAKNVGINIVVITGRECVATTRRMHELKVDYVFQNIKEKKTFLANFMKENNIEKEQIGYIGDDLNDYGSMKLVGFIGCPSDSCKEILSIADYISEKKGGQGAVRDVIEYIMTERGEWQIAIDKLYSSGV